MARRRTGSSPWRRGGRADVAHDLAHLPASSPGRTCSRPVFRSTPVRGGDRRERRSADSTSPVARSMHVDVAVALGADEHLPRLARPLQVEQDLLVDAVLVVEVVRAALVEPARLAGVGVAGEDAGGPLVVAGPLVGVPGAGIAGAVVEQVQLGVVGDPAPDRAAALLPGVRRPGRDAEVLALVAVVERLEARGRSARPVGAGAVGRQTTLPVSASSAVSQPRTPNSPPVLPTSTLSFTTSGAMVMVSPMLMSPTLVFQTSWPVSASTATRGRRACCRRSCRRRRSGRG